MHIELSNDTGSLKYLISFYIRSGILHEHIVGVIIVGVKSYFVDVSETSDIQRFDVLTGAELIAPGEDYDEECEQLGVREDILHPRRPRDVPAVYKSEYT